MYWECLPGRLANDHGGCVVLCLTLAEIHMRWITAALREERRKRHPHLFYKSPNHSLTPAEQNNEVNCYVGFAVASTLDLVKKNIEADADGENELIHQVNLLKSMIIHERDIDDEYMNKCYDTNMAMYNHGGLTLIRMEYFEWAKKLMDAIRTSFTEHHINLDPHNCFGVSEKTIMSNKSIRSDFILLCTRHSSIKNIPLINKTYDIFVPKAIHARYGVVFKRWKTAFCAKHGEVALRTKLKATAKQKKSELTAEAAKDRRDDIDEQHCAKKSKPSPATGEFDMAMVMNLQT